MWFFQVTLLYMRTTDGYAMMLTNVITQLFNTSANDDTAQWCCYTVKCRLLAVRPTWVTSLRAGSRQATILMAAEPTTAADCCVERTANETPSTRSRRRQRRRQQRQRRPTNTGHVRHRWEAPCRTSSTKNVRSTSPSIGPTGISTRASSAVFETVRPTSGSIDAGKTLFNNIVKSAIINVMSTENRPTLYYLTYVVRHKYLHAAVSCLLKKITFASPVAYYMH